MRYIKDDSNGYTSYDDYFRYVETIRDAIGEKLYFFASNPNRHDLHSKESLHDAWIRSLFVKSFYEGQPDIGSDLNHDICLNLLGAYHDRIHTFKYRGIQSCLVNFQFCQHGRKRDLLQHELRYEEGKFEHELVFDSDMKIEIICESMTYEEKILKESIS